MLTCLLKWHKHIKFQLNMSYLIEQRACKQLQVNDKSTYVLLYSITHLSNVPFLQFAFCKNINTGLLTLPSVSFCNLSMNDEMYKGIVVIGNVALALIDVGCMNVLTPEYVCCLPSEILNSTPTLFESWVVEMFVLHRNSLCKLHVNNVEQEIPEVAYYDDVYSVPMRTRRGIYHKPLYYLKPTCNDDKCKKVAYIGNACSVNDGNALKEDVIFFEDGTIGICNVKQMLVVRK